MANNLPIVPIGRIENGQLIMNDPWTRFFQSITTEVKTNNINVGSQISGVAASLAAVDQKAAQAQATANSAAAGVGTVSAAVAAGGGSGFYAVVDPPAAYGTDLGPATITTNSVTVTAYGGVGPYFYSWATGASSSASSPTAATTDFVSTSPVSPWVEIADYATCTVTDSTPGTPLETEVTVGVTFYATGTGEIP